MDEEKELTTLNFTLIVEHEPTEIELLILGERIGEWCREFCLGLQESQLGEKNGN